MRVPIAFLAFSLTLAIVPAAMSQDSSDVLPKVLQHSQPIYPPLARQTRIQGDVQVSLTTDGESVTDAEAVAGHLLLRKAAEENVRTWKFAHHNPATFHVTFRYKLASGNVEVEFLDTPALVLIEAPVPVVTIDNYAWIGLGTWKAEVISARGKTRQTFELFNSGPHEDWLKGNVLGPDGGSEEFDFGHKEGDFVAFTVKLRQRNGNQRLTFFVGKLKGNRIVGTFVDDTGLTGRWTAVRLPDKS